MKRIATSLVTLGLLAGCNTEPKRRSRPDTAPATLAHAVSYDAPNYLRRVGVICEFPDDPKAPRLVLDAAEGRGRYMARMLVEERSGARRVRPSENIEARMAPTWPTGWYATTLDEFAIELEIQRPGEPPLGGRAWLGQAKLTKDAPKRPVRCTVVGE